MSSLGFVKKSSKLKAAKQTMNSSVIDACGLTIRLCKVRNFINIEKLTLQNS